MPVKFLGEDFTVEDQVFQADGATPQDITGWTVEFWLYGNPGDASPREVLKSSTNIAQIEFTAPTTGNLRVKMLRADTMNLAPGIHWWYIRRVDAGFNAVVSDGMLPLNIRK
jgi:hypothetical protein